MRRLIASTTIALLAAFTLPSLASAAPTKPAQGHLVHKVQAATTPPPVTKPKPTKKKKPHAGTHKKTTKKPVKPKNPA